jgi:AraC-like DNA-binding protein
MKSAITTSGILPQNRSRFWHQTIAATYFPLDLKFREPASFSGELSNWQLGGVSLSRLTSGALQYRRLPHHFKAEKDEHFLVTVPARSEIFFSQGGHDVRCNPGGFILERSHEPYEFSHDVPADLWVMKVEAKALGLRLRAPDRFCSMQFNAAEGAGGLFADMLHLIPARFDAMSVEVRETVGRQLIDLLVLALKADERTLTTGTSTVREAHLTRIESFVRRHMGDAGLDPESIARACGISTRYLHELFRDTNQTVGGWIRDQRLEAVREALTDRSNKQSLAELAYAHGFGDQAQFSRSFRNAYGLAPKDFRAQLCSSHPQKREEGQ